METISFRCTSNLNVAVSRAWSRRLAVDEETAGSKPARRPTLDSRVIGRGPDVNGVLWHDGFACCPPETQRSRYPQYRDHFQARRLSSAAERAPCKRQVGISEFPAGSIPFPRYNETAIRFNASVAQLAEQQTLNLWVGGSIPPRGTMERSKTGFATAF